MKLLIIIRTKMTDRIQVLKTDKSRKHRQIIIDGKDLGVFEQFQIRHMIQILDNNIE